MPEIKRKILSINRLHADYLELPALLRLRNTAVCFYFDLPAFFAQASLQYLLLALNVV
jgi:hypothetical protein